MNQQKYIEDQLNEQFKPEFLQVVNESSGHNVPPGSESHFKVVIVSDGFANLGKVKRHQAVYAVLQEALQNGVHALALHTYSPAEWAIANGAPSSPECMG